MRYRPRIPIWLPLASALAVLLGVAYDAYPDLKETLREMTVGRKKPDIAMLRKVFTSPVPSAILEPYIQARVIQDAIRNWHRQTYARVDRLVMSTGERVKIADNRDTVRDRVVSDQAVNRALKIADDLEADKIHRIYDGIEYYLDGTHYHVIAIVFPMSETEKVLTGRALLVTNLDAAIDDPLDIVELLGLKVLIIIAGSVSVAVWFTTYPVIRLTGQIMRGQPITMPWWAPIQYERLALQMRLDQAANIQYKRKAEEAAALANSTINGITDAIIFLKDCNGVYLLCNEAFKPIAGRDPIGLTDDDLAWTAEQTAKYRAEDANVITTGEQLSVVEQIGGQPDSHWYITRKVRVSIEGRPAMLGISLDVDELVSARQQAENLAQEIQTVNHIAVHDIKADLTALNLGSELIQETIDELTEYLDGKSDDVIDEAIDTIKHFSGLNIKSARNAFDVLDQRNKLYNLESKIEIASCSVTDLLDSLSAAFSSEPGEMRIYNECPENQQILADKSLLMTVLKNIVRNGFVHNESPLKRVEVKVSPIGHRSRIQITDNGVGMPPTYLENWGKILGKAAQLSSKRGGSGTGLYSIRAIVLAHKGASIEVTSAVGQGTTFTLEFSDVS
jgi:signal transduction histidine kinase